MTYGQRSRASAKHQPLERRFAGPSASWGGYPAWRQLDPDLKLELIDQALRAANDRIDQFPLAL